MVDIFLPPGVQARSWQTYQNIPRRQTKPIAARIEALHKRRNQCPEEEIEAIDDAIFLLANIRIQTYVLNFDGRGDNMHRVYVLGPNTGWDSVTDVPCPACATGTIRWHEAGYVPGYRRCDTCERHFCALVQAGLDQRADGRSVLMLDSRYAAKRV